MSKIRIFIASHKQDLVPRLSKVMDPDAFAIVGQATNLMQAYTSIEEHAPDAVLVDEQLAKLAEFSMLDALFKALGTRCLKIGSGANERASWQLALDKLSVLNAPVPTARIDQPDTKFDPKRIILIGASTGGVDALTKMLGAFPENCPPTLIVQHTGRHHGVGLVQLLQKSTLPQVRVVEADGPINAGNVYLATSKDHHLTLNCKGAPRLVLQKGAPVAGHIPSIDVLFRSAADHARHTTAVILTGMGRDGAEGIAHLRNMGAMTIGQDEASSLVYGMPRVATELNGITQQAHIDDIARLALQSCELRPLKEKAGV